MSAEHDELLRQMNSFRDAVVKAIVEMDLEILALHLALSNSKPISKSRMQQFRNDVEVERDELKMRNEKLLPHLGKPYQQRQ